MLSCGVCSHNNYITMNPKKWQWILRRKEKQTASSKRRMRCLPLRLFETHLQIKNTWKQFQVIANSNKVKSIQIKICTAIRQLAGMPFGLAPVALRHRISLGLRLTNVSICFCWYVIFSIIILYEKKPVKKIIRTCPCKSYMRFFQYIMFFYCIFVRFVVK